MAQGDLRGLQNPTGRMTAPHNAPAAVLYINNTSTPPLTVLTLDKHVGIVLGTQSLSHCGVDVHDRHTEFTAACS